MVHVLFPHPPLHVELHPSKQPVHPSQDLEQPVHCEVHPLHVAVQPEQSVIQPPVQDPVQPPAHNPIQPRSHPFLQPPVQLVHELQELHSPIHVPLQPVQSLVQLPVHPPLQPEGLDVPLLEQPDPHPEQLPPVVALHMFAQSDAHTDVHAPTHLVTGSEVLSFTGIPDPASQEP